MVHQQTPAADAQGGKMTGVRLRLAPGVHYGGYPNLAQESVDGRLRRSGDVGSWVVVPVRRGSRYLQYEDGLAALRQRMNFSKQQQPKWAVRSAVCEMEHSTDLLGWSHRLSPRRP